MSRMVLCFVFAIFAVSVNANDHDLPESPGQIDCSTVDLASTALEMTSLLGKAAAIKITTKMLRENPQLAVYSPSMIATLEEDSIYLFENLDELQKTLEHCSYQ